MTFGETLRDILQEHSMTQTDLARTIHVPRSTISNYINRNSLPSEEIFSLIYSIFPYESLYTAYTQVTSTSVTSDSVKLHEIVIRNNKEENKLIAHALVYVVAAFEEEGLQALAPNDYWSYKILVEKYKPYLNG